MKDRSKQETTEGKDSVSFIPGRKEHSCANGAGKKVVRLLVGKT